MGRSVDEILKQFETDQQNIGIASPGMFGATIHILDQVCGGTANRYQFMKQLTGKVHSRDLTPNQQWALLSFVQPMKDPLTGKWTSVRGIDFEIEVGLILSRAGDQPGQEKLL